MKKLLSVLASLLILGLVGPVQAQQPHHGHRMHADTSNGGQMERPMMHSDRMHGTSMMQDMPMMRNMSMMQSMHQRMMQSPMHRAGMTAFMLPALADTLDLSSDQVNHLQEHRSALLEQRQTHRRDLQKAQQDLQALFDEGQPDPAAVRTHLHALADLHADQRAALYETAHAMRTVLTDAQRQQLDDMTPQQHMHQMMTRMSMHEAMQMMRAMHGACMMNGMGMMNRMGMMQEMGGMSPMDGSENGRMGSSDRNE